MPQAPTLGAPDDPRGLIPYIRDTAQKYGIDPDTAVNVARSEGLHNFKSSIPGENSFGAFQLYTGGGLGNDFQKATGLDPSDPKNEQAGIDYALKWASQHGWGAFHGAKNAYGYGPWHGITVGSPSVGPALSAPQMAAGSPSVLPGGGIAAPQQATPQAPQQATQQPLQGGSGGDASGMAAPLGAPAQPPAQLTHLPLLQLPARPPLNWAAIMARLQSMRPQIG